MRLGVVTNIFNPYQHAFLEAVSAIPGTSVTVYYCAANEPGRFWRPEATTYEAQYPWRLPTTARWGRSHVNPGILFSGSLRQHDFVVVSGWGYPSVIGCAIRLASLGMPWAIWIERYKRRPNRHPISLLKRSMLRRASAVLGVGEAALRAAVEDGAAGKPLLNFPYVADVPHIAMAVERLRRDRNAVRSSIGVLPSRPTLLFVGQLIPRKGLDVAIRACVDSRLNGVDPLLIVAGTGEHEAQYRAMADAIHPGGVMFVGHQTQVELDKYRAIADCAIVPSRYDGWGVVVHEFLAAGLPTIVSDQVGAAELIRDQAEWVVQSESPQLLGSAIRRVLAADHLAHRRYALSVAKRWTPQKQGCKLVSLARELSAAG